MVAGGAVVAADGGWWWQLMDASGGAPVRRTGVPGMYGDYTSAMVTRAKLKSGLLGADPLARVLFEQISKSI